MCRRVTVVGSVCVSHLTPRASVCLEIPVTYSVGNDGQEIVGFSLKLLCYRDPVLPQLKAICTVGHFPAESMHAHYSTRCQEFTK